MKEIKRDKQIVTLEKKPYFHVTFRDKSVGYFGYNLPYYPGIDKGNVSDPKDSQYEWQHEESKVAAPCCSCFIAFGKTGNVTQINLRKFVLQDLSDVTNFFVKLWFDGDFRRHVFLYSRNLISN